MQRVALIFAFASLLFLSTSVYFGIGWAAQKKRSGEALTIANDCLRDSREWKQLYDVTAKRLHQCQLQPRVTVVNGNRNRIQTKQK